MIIDDFFMKIDLNRLNIAISIILHFHINKVNIFPNDLIFSLSFILVRGQEKFRCRSGFFPIFFELFQVDFGREFW